MIIEIKQYFCESCLKIIKEQLGNDVINFEDIKNHIDNCDACKLGIKKGISEIKTKVNFYQLLSKTLFI
jgi:archaellum component FlaC